MSSFQGVGIEEFHCIQSILGGWNRGVPPYTAVSSFQGYTDSWVGGVGGMTPLYFQCNLDATMSEPKTVYKLNFLILMQ